MASKATRTQPFSVRLGPSASLLVADEARRSGRSRGAIVEELAEEAAKARLFPGIAFRGQPRRAWVIGSGLDVWELLELVNSYGGDLPALLDAHPLVQERHVRLALSYAERFPDEIEAFVDANNISLDELRALYPFIQIAD